MNGLQFMATPVIGGIIGYFTNWLAIKMLFLPREEKRVFGLRVPLTPGVLPKSKERLAAKIGETVGAYLLTEETIKEAILSSDMNESIDELLDSLFHKIAQTDKTIGDGLNQMFSGGGEAAVDKAKLYIAGMAEDFVEKEENKEKLVKILTDIIGSAMENADINKYKGVIFEKLHLFLEEKGAQYLESEAFILRLDGFIDGIFEKLEKDQRPVIEIIPESTVSGIKSFILSKTPEIADYVQKVLMENEELNDRLMELTKKVVDDSVGHFLSGFVYKKVYDNIKDSAISYISNAENMIIFAEQVIQYGEEVLQNDLPYFMDKLHFSQEIKPAVKEKLADHIKSGGVSQLSKGLLESADNMIDKVFKEKELPDIINGIYPNASHHLAKFVLSGIEAYYYNAGGKEKLAGLWGGMVDKVMDIPISAVAGFIGRENLAGAKFWILANEKKILGKVSDIFVKKLKVPQIIEQKINELEVREMETLVLSIASKELKYITYMGGVLGFIIGFIPLLMG